MATEVDAKFFERTDDVATFFHSYHQLLRFSHQRQQLFLSVEIFAVELPLKYGSSPLLTQKPSSGRLPKNLAQNQTSVQIKQEIIFFEILPTALK